ncbi:MAG: DUF4411 family protein [Spirochaetes bacterium]|nr:DUF4411 family protein [Spirochaetota bacterium]
MPNEKFLIDADTLIAPSRLFYPLDMFPDFWDFIEFNIASKSIKILDMVYDEIIDGKDLLSDWLSGIKSKELVRHKDIGVIHCYSNILNYINDSPFYKIEALNNWSAENTADAWLIAAAIVHSCTVITFEKPNNGLNDRYPSKNAKIPDVCKEFDIKCEDLYYMMRHLDFRKAEK